jgi:hypothetical protein
MNRSTRIPDGGPVRIPLHAAALALANLGGLWIGFVAFALAPTTNQLGVQLPVALVVSVGAFAAWVTVVDARGPRQLRFGGRRDAVLAAALAWAVAAVIFVPLHRLATGYVTAFSNLVALWSFQLVANLVVVALADRLGRNRAVDGPAAEGASR